uniref:Uncharacterized protein n=1 Tax=Anguilla anguilla TaxID=7936 RepID=A0A0E9WAZ7_ANGAN
MKFSASEMVLVLVHQMHISKESSKQPSYFLDRTRCDEVRECCRQKMGIAQKGSL